MANLRPFFPYYGSKWRTARSYPPPRHDLVVEPFAGSAGYSTYYNPENVWLFDTDPILFGVWSYLIAASPTEILRLPDLAPGQSVADLRVPQEARWLIGFWLNRGSAQPKQRATAFSSRTGEGQLVWGERARQRIASQVPSIRHWKVMQASYERIPPVEATWFVDPPYEDKGRHYRHHTVDFRRLGAWCQNLHGRVIVCENEGATWLPFSPHATIKATRGTSAEVSWLRPNRGGGDTWWDTLWLCLALPLCKW